MSGDAELAAFAQRLRRLGKLAPEAAKAAAPLVEAVAKETAAAGTTPQGEAWPAKRDGGRALPNAASAITAHANGLTVIVKLVGAYFFHHYSKGKDRRRVLPDSGGGIPPKVVAALREATKRTFERLIGK